MPVLERFPPLKSPSQSMEQLLAGGGAHIVFHVCASGARATSLSARPIRGLPWFLNGRARRDVGATRGFLVPGGRRASLCASQVGTTVGVQVCCGGTTACFGLSFSRSSFIFALICGSSNREPRADVKPYRESNFF